MNISKAARFSMDAMFDSVSSSLSAINVLISGLGSQADETEKYDLATEYWRIQEKISDLNVTARLLKKELFDLQD